jgi:zinc protease
MRTLFHMSLRGGIDAEGIEPTKQSPWVCRAAVYLLLSLLSLSGSQALAQLGVVTDSVQEFTVNGIDVILKGNPSTPVVSALLFIRGGSSALPADMPISTEYFAMAVAPASGTKNFSKAFLRRRMQMLGTYILGEDTRDYSVLTLRSVREALDTSWKYFTDIVANPTFDPVEFENFRKNVILGINSRQLRPDVYSRVLADSIFYKGHPYGRMLNEEDVNRQSIELVSQHYRNIMVRSRMLLVVVGNVSKAKLTEMITKSEISKLPQGNYVDKQLPIPPKSQSPNAYLTRYNRPLNTKYALAYFLIPNRNDPDYYAWNRLRNFFGGFVFSRIRVEHSLAYAPGVDDQEGKTSIGIITFETPHVDSAVRLIYDDVDFFQNNLIRAAAIRSGVGRWTTSNYIKQETAQSQAVALGQAKIMTGSVENAFLSYDKLASVTPEELVAAANKYLRNFNWVVVGDVSNVSEELLESR